MRVTLLTLAVTVGAAATAYGDAPTFGLDDHARQFFVKHCLPCHGSVKPKANLRLDNLTADFGDAANRDRWLAIRKRILAGEMPPKDRPRPSDDEVRALGDGIAARAEAAEMARRAASR